MDFKGEYDYGIKKQKNRFLGDSITYGVGTTAPEKVYWKIVEAETSAICKGHGVSGTRIARQVNPDPEAFKDKLHFITRISDIDADTDVIVIFGGVNDFDHGDAPMGFFTDFRDDTFYGALHLLYKTLIEKFPSAQIVVMTPLHCCDEKNLYFNTRGLRLAGSYLDYINAITEVAAYYSIPVLDLYRTVGLNPNVEEQKQIYMLDGLHPSDAGNLKIANRVIAFLKSL